MPALHSLARVYNWALNEKRLRLAGLEELGGKMRNDLATLEQQIEDEQRVAAGSMEGTIAFPAFVEAALERRKRLSKSIANLERAIEAARDEVHEAFQESKKFEMARDNNERRARDRRARRDQAELDELGLTMYERRRRLARDES